MPVNYFIPDILIDNIMKSTIHISVNSVAQAVYAASALKSYMASSTDAMPPLLTPDNRAAMSVAVRTAAHLDIPALLGTSCSVAKQNDDILEVTFESQIAPSLSMVNTIESMLASRILSRLFSLTDKQFAVTADDDARRIAESLKSGLFPENLSPGTSTDDTDIPLSVSPVFY